MVKEDYKVDRDTADLINFDILKDRGNRQKIF